MSPASRAHEKGIVEARSATSAATTWSQSLAELNARSPRPSRPKTASGSVRGSATTGQDFAAEVPLLVPVPDEPFETGTAAEGPARAGPQRSGQPVAKDGAEDGIEWEFAVAWRLPATDR